MNNSRYVPGVSMANATGGRVSVDINGTLHISPLTVWDRRLFVCIVSGKETGRVFLNGMADAIMGGRGGGGEGRGGGGRE